MSPICGCEFPENCVKWSDDCENAYFFNSTSIKNECKRECPVECKQVTFPMTRINSKWEVSQFEIDVYKEKMNEKNLTFYGKSNEEIKSRLVRVYIYYERHETTEITQLPSMSTLDLIASIGGLLGKVYSYLC